MRKRRQPKVKPIEEPAVQPVIELDNNIYNTTLVQDQMHMTEVLYRAMLYINQLETQLDIKYHKEARVANPERGTAAHRYYQALNKLNQFESRYYPPDPVKENIGCHRPWTAKTFTEHLQEREKHLQLLTGLASQMSSELSLDC